MKTILLLTAMLASLQAEDPKKQLCVFGSDYSKEPHVSIHAAASADTASLMDGGKTLGKVDKNGVVTLSATVAELDAFIAKLSCDNNLGTSTVRAFAMLFRAIAVERELSASGLPQGMSRR